MPEPLTPVSGFGMNVACTPIARATSFTTVRKVMIESAMARPSVARRSISCWPGAISWWLYSTGMPIASSAEMTLRRSIEVVSVAVWSK